MRVDHYASKWLKAFATMLPLLLYYDAVCLGAALALLWHFCVPIVMLQSQLWVLQAMRGGSIAFAKLGHATEQTISAIDEHVCAGPSPCNDVCRATHQALLVAQEKWLPICVAWAVLQSAMSLSTDRPTVNLADWTDGLDWPRLRFRICSMVDVDTPALVGIGRLLQSDFLCHKQCL